MILDVSGGHWLYRSCCQHNIVQGIAGILELHYTSSMQDADVVSGNGLTITDRSNRTDVLNLTVGLHAELGESLTLTTGMTFPLRNKTDRQFDNEIVLLANWLF